MNEKHKADEEVPEWVSLELALPTPEPPPEPAPTEPVQNELPEVELTVYLTASRRRQDQTAGFRRWALSRRLSKRTIPDWDNLWNEFQHRPT